MSTTSVVTSQLSDLPDVSTGLTSSSTTGSSKLGKDEFMKLLVTQMKYQDPLNPVDNTQMVAQLAQFSQLEQLQGLSSKVDNMVTASNASTQMTATQLVGKEALFEANKIGLVAGSTSGFTVTLAGASQDTNAVLTNSSGKVVRTLHLGQMAAGETAVTWDGKDDNGGALPSGEYMLSVAGTGADGSEVQAAASVRATITGVEYDAGVAKLRVGGRLISLSDVLAVYSPTTSA